MQDDAAEIVAEALRGSGVNLTGACRIEDYDQRAPAGYRSADLMPRARGVLVVGSAGRELWQGLELASARDPHLWSRDHPVDTHVAGLLDRADGALARARIGSRRFEPLFEMAPGQSLDFRALGEIVGLGSMGPFGLLIHREHGPWWALRGAWLLDVDVREASALPSPCSGCSAPCIGGAARGGEGIVLATAEVRSRCVVGQASKYVDEQIAYHYDREATLAKLRARAFES